MAGCCDPREYDEVFPSSYARRRARRYESSGLDEIAGQMVGFLAGQGLAGATVLEIGGGIGSLHLELLSRGAAAVTNLELSSSYDAEAARLLSESGMGGRVERRILDLAADPDAVGPADVVVLHRVVCCYPDFERLLAAAADHAGRALVYSYPRAHALNRALTAAENLGYAMRRRAFRTFVHDPEAMAAVVRDHGHRAVETQRTRMWQVTGAVRAGRLGG